MDEYTEVTLSYYNDEGIRVNYTKSIKYNEVSQVINLMDNLDQEVNED